MSNIDESKLEEKYGAKNLSTAIILASSFGNALGMHPGHVMQLLSKASDEELKAVKTGRQALALLMKEYAKAADASYARAEAQNGEGERVEIDLSCVKDLFEYANGDLAAKERSPSTFVDGPDTLQ